MTKKTMQVLNNKSKSIIKINIIKRNRPKNHVIPHLPCELLEEIFTKVSLPIKTILGCQNSTNSKQLSCIFSDPKLIQTQTNKYTRPCILVYNHGLIDNIFLIECANYDKDDKKDEFLITKIWLDFIGNFGTNKKLNVLNSCNGLLLVGDYGVKKFPFLRVINPLTRECIPLHHESNFERFSAYYKSYYAIGYSPNSNKYKVLGLIGELRPSFGGYSYDIHWHAEILTLGTNTWRKIDEHDIIILYNAIIEEGPVIINGSMYWLSHIGPRHEIIQFEIEFEQLKLISSPLSLDGGGLGFSLSSIGVVNNFLCVGRYETRRYGDLTHGMDLFKLSEDGVWNIWKKINLVYYPERCIRKFQLIYVNEDEDELLLMLLDPMKLVYYDAKNNTAKEAHVCGVEKMKGVVYNPNLMKIRTCIT